MKHERRQNSGRQWRVALVAAVLGLALAGCSASAASSHEHEWEAATCETPRVCKTCGETDGEPLGHTWQEATCLAPKTCTVCGKTEGRKSEDHVWGEATCTEREKCVLCGRENLYSEPLGHDWIAPTLEEPYTCARCGEQQGEPLQLSSFNRGCYNKWKENPTKEQYVGMSGYVAVTHCSYVYSTKDSPYENNWLAAPWYATTYEKDKQFFNPVGTVEHKTPVTVIGQELTDGEYGKDFSGYLLVEQTDNGEQFYMAIMGKTALRNFLADEKISKMLDNRRVEMGLMPDERKVAALSTLFGQWAIEGGAKITNNLGAYEKALAMVSDPSLYTGSMEREFIIQASTSESIDTMVKNSVTALKQDIGTEFLPVKKTLSLAVIDLMNGVRKDMPQLQTLAGTLADLLSAGISKLGDALQAALPYVQKALDYVADNGPQVAGILGGLAGTFAAMKFAPLAGNLLEGAGSLLFGESGGLGVAAGGSERSGGLLGAVGSLFTGGQKFAGNAVGTISNVAEAAGVGATMANSNMTRTQWGAVTSNGSGSFMQRLENSAIGAYFGIKNRGTLTNQKGTDYKFMQGLMGVAGQITDAKQGGGLLDMAKNAVASSPIGQYFGGIRAAAGNVANTTIGSKIVGFGKGTIGVSKEILAGIAGPEGLGLTNLVSGAKGLAQNGAGWVAGKAGNVISTVANSGVGQAIGGAAGKVGGVAKGVVSVGSNALGALGNFAGAGAGLLGSVWGPVAGGFGSLFAGAAPVIAAISGIIAVVSILGDHLEDIRGIVVNVFGETGGQVFDVFTGKLQGVADFVTGLFSEGGVTAALAPLQNTITNLFGENAGAAFGGVVTILQSIMGVVGQIVTFATGTVKPIIQDVFTFITGTVLPIILQTFTTAAPTIASIISNIGSAVMTGMQIIGSAIQAAMPIIQGIITVIMTIGSVVVPALLAGFEAFSAGISAVMSAIQGFFQGLITFITGVFSGSWSQAWEGIKQIFGSAFDGLVALCKAPLNAVIAIINKAISGINGLGLTIPKWVPILGGKSFSVNIPTLPMLAMGGFTDGVSIAGEAGTEAVISFQRGVRSDNINTWTQAGRMLGVSGEQAAVAAGVPYADGGGAVELATIDATQGNNAVELQEIDTGKPQPEQGGGGTPDGGGQVVFAPQIVVQGNADRAVLESVLDDAQQRFELWYEQMMRRKARTAY